MTARPPRATPSGPALDFSALGFGAAPLGNMRRALSETEARATVRRAWDLGLRYFDTAPLYGHGLSEVRLGVALGGEARDSFVVSTKVGRRLTPCAPGGSSSGIYVDTPDLKAVFDYSYDGVMASFEASLVRLGLARVDIVYVHDIDALTHGSEAAAEARTRELIDAGGWRALADLRAEGVITAIGAGVNACAPCERLLDLADPDIFLLAGRYTLLDQSALGRLLPRCQARGVRVVAGGPFNSGVLATGAAPGAFYDYAPAGPEILARTRALEAVCRRHGVPLAQAALQFPGAHPAVACVIPGGQSPEEVVRNVALHAAKTPAALWDELKARGLIAAEAPTPQEVQAC